MSQLAPVMLTAEQFNQLATKDYLDKTLDERLKDFAKKDDLKDFATKEDIKELSEKMEERFNLLDYKIDTNVAQSYKDTNNAILNHEIRIKKLESKYI